MVKTPKTVKLSSAQPTAYETKQEQVQPVAIKKNYDLKAFETPEGLMKSLTDITQKSDPITKEILSSAKVSEMAEVGNCLNLIVSGGKSLVAATKKKPSFFSTLIGRVKDNIEAVKDQFKNMQDKFDEVSKTLDTAVANERKNIELAKKKITILEYSVDSLERFISNASDYHDTVVKPEIERLKASGQPSDLIKLTQMQNYETLLEGAIDDARRFVIIYRQSIMNADQSITTSYTAIYTVTVKTKSALAAFADSAAQYIGNKKTEITNNISKNITDALEAQLLETARLGKENALAAAANATRPAASIEVLEQVANTFVESMEGVSSIYQEAKNKREADLPRLDTITANLENAIRKS